MTHHLRCLAVALALAGLAPPGAAAAESLRVVELFTSQGCSACPPADGIIHDLADRPGVVALSLAVDYWDYLGWKDTLARPAHAARQRAYAEARGDRRVFTPQIIVNGRDSAPGHDRAAIDRLLSAPAATVPVTAELRGGRVEVRIGAGAVSGGEVWALGVQRTALVAIGRGENAGKTATYRNVVRTMTRLAAWSGEPLAVSAAPADLADESCDLVVVVVQDMPDGQLGAIVGAARTALR